MTNTPLDPDAFASAEEYCATYGEYSTFREQLRMGIGAYLASVHPVVNTIEELDALPLGTTIQDSDEDCVLQALERGSILGTEWYIPGVEKIFTSKDIELPARVLYLPETTNGR